MTNFLLILGIVIIGCGYLLFLITYFFHKNKDNKKTSLDLVISSFNNNSINIIKSNSGIFSKYNIERKMIKLSDNTYDKNDNFSLGVATLLCGYAGIESKFLKVISKIFKEIKVISFLPVINIFCISICNSRLDFKIAIFLLIVVLIYLYFFDYLNSCVIENCKVNNNDVVCIVKSFSIINKMFFIGTLVEVIRFLILLF